MFGKQLTSLVLSSLMAVSLFCTPVMNMTAYAAEETPGAIITDNNISLEDDGEIIEEEQNDEGTPEIVLEESDNIDVQEAEEQGTDVLEEDDSGNDGQDEIDEITTSSNVEDETDPLEDLPEENTEDADDLSQNIDNSNQTVDPVSEEDATMESENEAAEDQGIYVCGDTLRWDYDGTETITISGTGSMYDYTPGQAPFSEVGSVSKIVIENGVTYIGQNAFYGMSTVVTVNIPGSVTQIGEDAFTMCDSLAEINYAGTLNEWSNIEGGDFCNDLSVIIHATDGVLGSNGQLPIGECVIDELSAMTYTGEELTQPLSIRNGDKVLIANTDYTVEYANNINAGTAIVTITGQGEYTGSVEKSFTITPKKITPSVTISNKTCTYNGQNRNPAVTVKYGNIELIKGQDYTVRYATNCSAVGTYNAAVTLKGNYSGSKKASYTIIPKTPKIYSVIDLNSKFDVKIYKQTEQTTGYQIQYSLSSSFASGNKTVTISKNTITEKTITKPESGKTYYVRVRTYKKVGTSTYYSLWSKATSTVVKRTLKSKEVYTLSAGAATSFTITLSNRMMIALAYRFDAMENISTGGIRIIAKDKDGKAVQSDYFDFKGCKKDYGWENWCWSGVSGKDEFGLFLPPGDYKYTIKNTSDGDIKLNYSVLGYVKMAETASLSSNKTVVKGEWVNIGKIGEGVPYTDISLGDNQIINNFYIDSSKKIWVYGNKLGTTNVSVKLRNGKKYVTKVTVKGSNPDFMAYLYEYNTRDNYFTVKVKNLRGSDLVIIRNGAKVEDVDYKHYDRWIKSDGNVTVKYGETKYIRFYVNGSVTWPNYKDYTLLAKIRFEGETYDWHVWYNDSVFKKNGGWYKTYWDDDKYAQWY